MIILTCPNCSANLEIDESRQFAFCQYCGTKIANLNNSFELNRTAEIDNLVIRMLEFEQRGDIQRCTEYCTRILDLDPYNLKAREVERRLPTYSVGPNVTIVYRSVHDDRFKLRITLDGRKWDVLSKNETLLLDLPEGKHRITFSGKKTYTYDITVVDKQKKITIVYTADRRRNTIEQHIQ